MSHPGPSNDREEKDLRGTPSGRDGPVRSVGRGRGRGRKRFSEPVRHPKIDVASLPGARRAPPPPTLAPQLATRVEEAPRGDGWVHEIKFDGYRLIAWVEGRDVRLRSRNGKDWTERFPHLAAALGDLDLGSAVLDGELVALQSDGTSSFRQLQEALASKRSGSLIYEVFDLPHLDGYDLADVELVARKAALKELLASRGVNNRGRVRYVPHFEGKGGELYDEVCQLGLEGIMSKRRVSRYRSGRTTDWLKVKCVEQGEFVVGGYTDPSSARIGFGSLLLGVYDARGQLIYTGNVGTGFSAQRLRSLYQTLRELETDECPFAAGTQRLSLRGVHWVRPELVADVEYSEWTRDGALRHPVFRGLREDRSPEEIVDRGDGGLGNALPLDLPRPSLPIRALAAKNGNGLEDVVAGVRLSHPDRVLFAEQGITKLHLARYYEQIGQWILPHLAGRPLALLRCPSGTGEACFFQKHPPEGLSSAVGRVAIEESGGEATHLYVDSLKGLVALVQIGVLELHCWGCRIDTLETPDLLVLDLDPGPGVTWPRLLEGALGLKERVERLGLQTFPKLTGGKGLHLVAPIAPARGWDDVKRFALAIAEAEARERPDRFTTNMAKSKRTGRIFIDYLRNGRGATAIAPYSTRARPGAPVAVPVAWDELDPASRSDRYAIDTVRRRLAALRKDPWAGFEEARTTITDEMIAAASSPDGAR
ncbi:MAG TPA: DNA ligase D [Gammaproteobacteria bacterium]|nr:DNA ligase D [Gammaproteobacteria bacterium]